MTRKLCRPSRSSSSAFLWASSRSNSSEVLVIFVLPPITESLVIPMTLPLANFHFASAVSFSSSGSRSRMLFLFGVFGFFGSSSTTTGLTFLGGRGGAIRAANAVCMASAVSQTTSARTMSVRPLGKSGMGFTVSASSKPALFGLATNSALFAAKAARAPTVPMPAAAARGAFAASAADSSAVFGMARPHTSMMSRLVRKRGPTSEKPSFGKNSLLVISFFNAAFSLWARPQSRRP
mmetsp:Transcript_16319/g.34459  ORF Transcript_16319/g.34459 Transcript_16319/m.34459 type:complete len:236 (-) Transcript_16319:1375-2082(-)